MRMPPRRIELILLVLILLIGATLRFVALDTAPPGLTHDEADHANDAAGVVNGIRPIYFTVGYGREPLFDYTTALTMLVVGQNYLASRLTAALFGMALLVLVYRFIRKATGSYALALAAMAGLTVSFWAIMVSREALRTVTLPVMVMAAALSLWHGLFPNTEQSDWRRFLPFALAGLFLGLSLYTYLAARVMWAVFPALFIYLALTRRDLIKQQWPGLLLMLVLAALIAAPLFIYLNNHPTAEVRIGQLSYPIDEARAGRFSPLLTNVRAGLGMLTFYGDDLWLYNIPGKPLLDPVMGVLFYVGFVLAVIGMIAPRRTAERIPGLKADWHIAHTFMLLMLGAGLFPALVTGVGASNTRVIGLQPALYYFPALTIIVIGAWAHKRFAERGTLAVGSTFAVLVAVTTSFTIHQYFTVWNNARDVRVAYHTTLVETLHYIDAHPQIGPEIALSSITPGQFHDPAVVRMHLQRDDVHWRFFDGRSVFLLPGDTPLTVFYPEVAPPDESFGPLLEAGNQMDTITLRDTDFNRTVEVLVFDSDLPLSITDQASQFGDALLLLGHHIPDDAIQAGTIVEVLTTWQVTGDFSGELVLFTHLLDSAGTLAAQHDELGYPSTSWRIGDTFIQLHRLALPADLPPGLYDVRVGAYTRPDIVRLPVFDSAGDPIGDSLLVQQIEVSTP